jgi:hypothetical protein
LTVAEDPPLGDFNRVASAAMNEDTREWIRNHAGPIGVVFMVLGGVVLALIATFLFPTAGKTVMKVGAAVLVLAFAAFYAWAEFPLTPRKYSTVGTSTLTIGQQLKRTRALFQRIVMFVLVAWCVGVTLLAPNLTSAQRNGSAIVGGFALAFAGWLLVRNRLRCPLCGSDFKKERVAKLGRWSMDTRGTTELWDACPHCGVSFNEPTS